MAMMRGVTAAFLLLPALFVDGAASAAEHAAPTTPGALVSTVLPARIHQKPSGRYVRDMCDHSKKHHCLSSVLMPIGWTPDQPVPPKRGREGFGGGSSSNGMAPTDVVAAYNLPASAKANGKIVAILDSPDSKALSDLQEYRSTYGLPAMARCPGTAPVPGATPCLAQVSEDGTPSTLTEDGGEDGDGETSLDMDMISAACPDCSILLVEIGGAQGNFGDSDFVAGAQTAAKLGASATSISIGGPEEGNDPTGYTTPGHLVLAASGDYGYNLVNEGGNGPSYPASAPDILAVGGTELFSTGSTYGEGVWNDGTFGESQNGQDVTTSGCSAEFAALTWQATALAGTSCTKRANADVSAAATFSTGGANGEIAIASYEQGWEPVEGTSASSPMVAGILTRLGLTDEISANLGWVYTNAAAFNDLGSTSYPVAPGGESTDAANPASCGKMCSVATGWDGPSGVGTPNGTKLAALSGTPITPPAGVDAGSPAGVDSGTTPPTTPTGTGTGTSPTGPTSPTSPVLGVDGGTVPTSTSTGIALGMPCSASPSCLSGLCGAPTEGAPDVCTAACSAATATAAAVACATGFTCSSETSGYCFAPSNGVDVLNDGGGSAGGCAVSGRGSNAAGLGWLSAGLAFVVARRRRRRG